MHNEHATVRSTTTFSLVADQYPTVSLEVELRYDTHNPFAVVAAFQTTPTTCVEWIFARDLLADGLLARAGVGDIRIMPAVDNPEVVLVELNSPAGYAVFSASAQDLADFLDQTYDFIVPGNESLWIDFDEAFKTLLPHDAT